MDMQSLIEKSHIGHWMKRSGKTFDDLDKYEKYEYEQTIKLLKITTKQFDMVNSSKKTPGYNSVQRERDGEEPMRHYLSKENQYGLMPELLDKIIDLGLDIGIYCDIGRNGRNSRPFDLVAWSFEPDVHAVGGKVAHQKWKEKVNLVNESFRDLTTQNTSHNDLTMYVELAERIRDVNVEQVSLKRNVNTEIFCIKEEFKLEIERNKAIQDKHVVDIKSMIICNRIVFGVLIIVYITFEIYKNYNFGSREDVCQVKQITHN